MEISITYCLGGSIANELKASEAKAVGRVEGRKPVK